MKKIVNIARTELASMFYSPIAWLLLIVFFVQAFSFFIGAVEQVHDREISMARSGAYTMSMYIGFEKMFTAMLPKLFYYIPLLTMGVIAREIHSGSIKLLLSSPVKTSDIIFGKYLALMVYCALLMMVFVLSMFVAASMIENFEYTWVLSGIFGLYLLVCAYAAIGLFMSCLTSHQVVAAISTLAVLALLSAVGKMGVTLPFVNEVTSLLSLSGRVEGFLYGLITTENIAYFLLIIGMFLYFSILKLSASRKNETKLRKSGKYAFVMMLTIVVGFVTARPGWVGSFDITQRQIGSLSAESLKIIAPLRDKKWKLTAYVNILDENISRHGLPHDRTRERKTPPYSAYRRYMPYMETDFKMYYKKPARIFNTRYTGKSELEMAQSAALDFGIDFDRLMSPQEVSEVEGLEQYKGAFTWLLEVDGHRVFFPGFADDAYFPSENEISVAIKHFFDRPLRIAIVTGHEERGIQTFGARDFQLSLVGLTVRQSRINQGYDVVETGLEKPVTQDVDILVIADPRTAYNEVERQNLRDYIARGGDLLLAGDMARQDVLNPVLKELGVELTSDQVLEKKEGSLGSIVGAFLAPDASQRFSGIDSIKANITASLKYDLQGTAIQPSFSYTPLYKASGPNVWSRKGVIDLESQALSFNAQTDTKGEFTFALALARNIANKDQRIIVLSDGDILSIGGNNFGFVIAAYDWLGHDMYPLDLSHPPSFDNVMSVNLSRIFWLRIMLYGVFPTLIFLSGFILLYRRRQG